MKSQHFLYKKYLALQFIDDMGTLHVATEGDSAEEALKDYIEDWSSDSFLLALIIPVDIQEKVKINYDIKE